MRLPPRMKKKMERVDAAFAIVRHITAPSCTIFLNELNKSLDEVCSGHATQDESYINPNTGTDDKHPTLDELNQSLGEVCSGHVAKDENYTHKGVRGLHLHEEMFATGDESTQAKDVKDTDNLEFANLHFHRIPNGARPGSSGLVTGPVVSRFAAGMPRRTRTTSTPTKGSEVCTWSMMRCLAPGMSLPRLRT